MKCFTSHLLILNDLGKAFPSLQPVNGLPLPLQARGETPLATLPPRIHASRNKFRSTFIKILVLGNLSIGFILGLQQSSSAMNQTQPIVDMPFPVIADVVRVIDGDTFVANVYPWPNLVIRTRVRFEKIQAPEIKHRAKCEKEAALGRAATIKLENIMPAGTRIQLLNVRPGRYSQRVIASVRIEDGTDPAHRLLELGLVAPWGNKADPQQFCRS